MKQTAVEWLIEQLKNEEGIDFIPSHIIEKAKAMEKQIVIDIVEKSRATGLTAEYLLLTYGSKGSDEIEKSEKPINPEISDEQIEYLAKEHILYNDVKRQWLIEGMKLYREQLKKK